jgi:predicted transcriptional regulator
MGPHPDDEDEVRAALADAEAGRLLSAEESAAYLRWLETGEGEGPWGDGSG